MLRGIIPPSPPRRDFPKGKTCPLNQSKFSLGGESALAEDWENEVFIGQYKHNTTLVFDEVNVLECLFQSIKR
jgi:hypothetical protein